MPRVITDFVFPRGAGATAPVRSPGSDYLGPTRRWLLVLLAGWVLAGAVPPAGAEEFGRAAFKVVFPEGKIGHREPLVVSGAGQDVLFVWYSGKNEIRIGFYHLGAGGPISTPVSIVPGREYDLELNLGCFYPPLDHPAFAGWPGPGARLLQQKLVVLLNEDLVLNTTATFHPAPPENIHFGENPGPYVAPGRFSGTLGPIRRLGIPPPPARLAPSGEGPVRLTVRFPEFHQPLREPLVSTGHSPVGDLLYVTYVAPGRIRFGHDSWGAGSIETIDASYKPEVAQTIELDMPSLSSAVGGPNVGRFILRFNGTVLMMADDRPYHPGTPAELRFGANGSGSTVAEANFSGEIDRVERIRPFALSADEFQSDPGPVRLLLRFPKAIGRYEPLLVTGHNSAADIIFVHYVDESHVAFGYDHWSSGGPVTAPIPVDYAAIQALEIQLGSLYPDDPSGGALPVGSRETILSTVRVKLNGRTVLTHQERAYPSTPAEILTGMNPVGATTCERLFTGRIFHRERMGPNPLPP